MAKEYAVRNISKCTKDCLCLYVCPTGAADTENSIIDIEKCIGCGACFRACPSRAISMVPKVMPKEQAHDGEVVKAMNALFKSKVMTESLTKNNSNKLIRAASLSSRIMAEDISRESGFMLPQGENAKVFLTKVKDKNKDVSEIDELLNLLKFIK